MIPFVAATAILAGFAIFVLHRADADLRERGSPGALVSVSLWLLYFFHADCVGAAAFSDVARFDVPPGPALVSGALVAVVGVLFFLAATVSLVRHGAVDGSETTRIVTSGPFRVTRHPQNAGWAIVLPGRAVVSRSLIGLALVLVFALFATRFARLEERHLLRRFGTAHASYRTETPGLLPSFATRRT